LIESFDFFLNGSKECFFEFSTCTWCRWEKPVEDVMYRRRANEGVNRDESRKRSRLIFIVARDKPDP